MFVPELTREYYADKEALAQHVVALLRAELEELRSAGADFVQFDEPVLTEVAFAPGRTRTFMCAALAARRDPAEELEFALSLINEVVAGIDDLRLGVHVCRGNWSRGARSARTSVRTADSARFRRFLETCQSSVRLSRVPAAHPTRAISQPIQPRLLGTTSTHEPKTSNAPTRYNSQLIRSVVTASVQAS